MELFPWRSRCLVVILDHLQALCSGLLRLAFLIFIFMSFILKFLSRCQLTWASRLFFFSSSETVLGRRTKYDKIKKTGELGPESLA